MAENTRSRRIITPVALGSYVTVFTPRASKEGKPPKYSIALLWEKEDSKLPKSLIPLQKAIEEMAVQKWGANAPKLLAAGKIKNPLRDGDLDRPDDKVYANRIFASASAKANRKPGIVDMKGQPVFEESEAYSGCYFRASVALFPYDTEGNKGIGLGLNNLQLVRKGERIDGRKDAADEFAEFTEAGANDPNSIDDIA